MTTPTDKDLRALAERLTGKYRVPITDGLGATGGGDEPDNPDEFVRTFETPPIQKEASAAIIGLLDRIEAGKTVIEEAAKAVADLKLELSATRSQLEEAEKLLEEYHKFGLIIDSAVRYSERDTENTKAIGDLILRHSNRRRAKAGGTDGKK